MVRVAIPPEKRAFELLWIDHRDPAVTVLSQHQKLKKFSSCHAFAPRKSGSNFPTLAAAVASNSLARAPAWVRPAGGPGVPAAAAAVAQRASISGKWDIQISNCHLKPDI